MAFVKTGYEIGDKVILSQKIEACCGYFEPETEVIISDIDPIRGYSIKDEYGNELCECGWEL
jgi:hypothetical protein